MNNIDVLKNALTIKPLIFDGSSEKQKKYSFVDPCFVDPSVRPVTDDDIKTLKTYLNAIIKLDRYHGTANVAEITNQGAKENTQSSDEVATFLEDHGIKYDMFDNQDLENALKQCEQCKPAPQEAKTKEKAIKFLQTLIKQPLINKKASKKVTDYLNAQKITYSAVSKKSLRKAIKDCKNKPVCQNFNKEDKQNAINYLTGLLKGKKARGIIKYQDVRRAYASKVAGILQRLKIDSANSVIKGYLRKEHIETLKSVDQAVVTKNEENSFTNLLENDPGADALTTYEQACKDMTNAICTRLQALSDNRRNVESAYSHYTDALVNTAKKGVWNPQTANVVRSLGEETATMTSITHGMDDAGALVGELDKLVNRAEAVIDSIEPLAQHLKRWSGKARMLGKTTLYTKMSDSLEEQLEKVRGQVHSLITAKNTLICVSCGLVFVDGQGQVSRSKSSVMELLEKLDDINNKSTSLAKRLANGETLPGSYVGLIDCHRKQSETIRALTGLINDETERLNTSGLYSGRTSPGLPKFVDKMSNAFEKAGKSIAELSAGASRINEFIRDAEHSVVGRIALFKEKHRVSIDTAKALTQVVKQVVDAIPK